MTLDEFKALRRLQDQRVHITFTDGRELIATLSSVTTDIDESRHLVYEKVEWSSPHSDRLRSGTWYSPGEELVSCVSLDMK